MRYTLLLIKLSLVLALCFANVSAQEPSPNKMTLRFLRKELSDSNFLLGSADKGILSVDLESGEWKFVKPAGEITITGDKVQIKERGCHTLFKLMGKITVRGEIDWCAGDGYSSRAYFKGEGIEVVLFERFSLKEFEQENEEEPDGQ